ncbi:MAG: cytochrome c peroxidase [Bacteroidota bacterium]
MKKKYVTVLLILLVAGVWQAGCRKDTISPDSPGPIAFNVPAGWPQPAYSFAANPLTRAGFELGRKLFYDVRLSRDNTISCGSCHQQSNAFAHADHALSHGVNDLLGTRNTPGLSNMAWHTTYFWDGGVNNLESQPINPIQNHVEMDMTMPEVIARVGADAGYRSRFRMAFGDEGVNSQRIFKAMAQFMGAMVSADSKYDRHVNGTAGGDFTASELNGLSVFRQKCAGCHKEPLFSDFSFRNNGLAPTAVNDTGRIHITGDAADRYKFKVPSLRDVALTAPYMHDGRFTSLSAVLEHYTGGIHTSPTLDGVLTGGLSMTEVEKHDVLNFLNTLTDTTFTKDKRFSEPR